MQENRETTRKGERENIQWVRRTMNDNDFLIPGECYSEFHRQRTGEINYQCSLPYRLLIYDLPDR
jgi:hypothetical protein